MYMYIIAYLMQHGFFFVSVHVYIYNVVVILHHAPITYKLASIHVQVYIEVYICYLYKYRFRKGNFEICHVA